MLLCGVCEGGVGGFFQLSFIGPLEKRGVLGLHLISVRGQCSPDGLIGFAVALEQLRLALPSPQPLSRTRERGFSHSGL